VWAVWTGLYATAAMAPLPRICVVDTFWLLEWCWSEGAGGSDRWCHSHWLARPWQQLQQQQSKQQFQHGPAIFSIRLVPCEPCVPPSWIYCSALQLGSDIAVLL
jgi:hypothetical protein